MTNPKRNIVLVINDLKGNGAERVVITLASAFSDAGHQASIVCFKKHIELPIPESIPVHIFSEKRFRWIPRRLRGRLTAPWLDRFIKKRAGPPDLVLSNLIPSDRILAYSKLPGVHFVIHSTTKLEIAIQHGRKQQMELAERKQLYGRKPSVCVSNGVKQDLRELLDTCATHCITTIHNPVDIDKIETASRETPDDIIPDAILHVGKFNKAKRQDRLIQAYAAIDCDNPLVFIGQGPLMQDAKHLVNELGLNDRVHFMGFRKNPYPYMKAAELHVLCSDYEGLGVVLLESICLQTPTISSNCPSGPNEILPPENLFETNNFDDFTQLLRQAIETPEAFRIPLNEKFTTGIAVEHYLKLVG
ncbi:MAG: glycosyltransferase [Verrucomicrobia bacterium]|nr:glycosyltransferase [Verrucomicrobiota bacterium]